MSTQLLQRKPVAVSRQPSNVRSSRSSVARLQLETLEQRNLLSCSTPTVQTVRGKDATFDQCFNLQFEHDGTDYEVSAYYTETTTAADLTECDAGENAAGRCEHLLANIDNGDGDNIQAVSMATQARDAFKFFLDRNLKFLPAGETELEVYIAEDPRGGGVPTANSLLCDDELVDLTDVLWEELLAYHELHHLVQGQYDGSWDDFYGEGIARSIEDRVRTDLDADTGHLFIPQITNAISNAGNVRTTDLYAQSYDTAAWWTWLWDQYRIGAAEDPPVDPADLGWDAIRDFYLELESQPSDELGALADFISGKGSTFRQDFIDYTLALYAQSFNPADPRLGYIDDEINAIGPLSGHTVINSAPAFGNVNLNLTPRTSQYIEFNPASQCDYTAFSFDGNGKNFGFSVMTVDGGTLQKRWTSYSDEWARTVRTADLDRVVGVVTSFDQSGSVSVGRGCVSPDVNIKSPTTSSFAMVGTADNPRSFIVRLSVTGGGAPIAGLVADEFTVTLKKSGSADAPIPVEVINASYVLDDYWLLVQAPDEAAGAETGSFYNLSVSLGADTDTENFSVVYLERTQDVMLVLDRSGSMGGTTGKIEAARNAANLLVNALADNDQGDYVAFDTDAEIQVPLDELSNGTQRQDLEDAIAAEVPLDFTSIGDGLRAALDDYNANGNPDNLCSIVLMSDGHENEPSYWADVKDDIIAAGCPVHTISFGPGANEVLMQEISGTVSGGTHDYATSSGGVPINSVIGWENNISRIYENKATEIAGRQRIFTVLGDSAIGGVATGIIDFEDHSVGTQIHVGDTFVASGVPGKGMPFQLVTGGLANGVATVGNQQMADGAGHDLQLNNINVGFDFAQTLESASALFGYFGGNLNVTINGELFNARTLSLLQGKLIGGVTVNLTMFDNQHGRLDFKGDIKSLALGGQEFWIDDLRFNSPVGNFHEIPVDKGADVLVVSAAWQETMGGAHTELFDPDGNPVPAAMRRLSSKGTNEVWRVPDPKPGLYKMRLHDIPQEYFMTASVRSEFELFTFVGQPQEDMVTGVEVPLVASFISNEGPVLDANVTATVMDPGGTSKLVKLWDDGNHGDGEADDGVYANVYTATSFGDVVQLNPDLVVEGSEPQGVGSYQVTFKAKKDEIVREGLGSFVLNRGKDSDGDGLPDGWEIAHGLNPGSRLDRDTDLDKDGLPASCEYLVGTDPRNSDTDDGGRSDGAEVQFVPGQLCRAVRDPLDPADDRLRKVTGIVALPEATLAGGPHVRLKISIPDGSYLFSRILRRQVDDLGRPISDWLVLDDEFKGPEFDDRRVEPDTRYEYCVIPFFLGGPDTSPVQGGNVASNIVDVKKDPYAPTGSVLINGGDEETYSPLVTLNIIADDSGETHDFEPNHQPSPGSPLSKLKIKLSNRPDFAGADWQPFQPVVEHWFLGDIVTLEPLQASTRWVYVAFMDEAGNVSNDVINDNIQVLLQPGDTFPFDGDVDLDDLNAVRNNFGQQGAADAMLRGDAIGAIDGQVNLDDLNLVRNYFGQFVDSPTNLARGPARRMSPAIGLRTSTSEAPAAGVTRLHGENSAATDALFARFTEVGVNVESLVMGRRSPRLGAKRST